MACLSLASVLSSICACLSFPMGEVRVTVVPNEGGLLWGVDNTVP